MFATTAAANGWCAAFNTTSGNGVTLSTPVGKTALTVSQGNGRFLGDTGFRPGGAALPADVLIFDDASIANLEPTPITVRYTSRLEAAPLGGFLEATAIYCRLDPVGAAPQQRYGFYGEITNSQADASHGALFKVVHQGHGDAFFVGLFGSGSVAYEAASLADETKGIISTLQGAFPNSVLFNALWNQAVVPTFGMYYADQAPGHALTIRKLTGALDGNAQIRMTENDFARSRFSVFNSGTMHLESLKADSVSTLRESPELRLRGAYWTGSTNQDRDAGLKHVVTGAAASELRAFLGNVLSETVAFTIKDNGDVVLVGKPKWAAANEQTTVGAAGGASALPATPTKYLKVLDSTGATLVIPAYAAS